MSEEQTKKEMEAQDKKFAYKKPESAYANRNDPKKSATAQGKAFTGVSPSKLLPSFRLLTFW